MELEEETVTLELRRRKKCAGIFPPPALNIHHSLECIPFIEIIFLLDFSASHTVQYKRFSSLFLKIFLAFLKCVVRSFTQGNIL